MVTVVGATTGCRLWFIEDWIVSVQRTAFAQTFFGKSLTKNFSERIKRQGLRPRTPWNFAVCGRRQGLCPLTPQAFEKA